MLPYRLPSYVFGPKWFYGFDSIIELAAIIISILLVYYSYKCYKLTSEERFLYFSVSFFSLTLAFIMKVVGTLAIYLPMLRNSVIGNMVRGVSYAITVRGVNALTFLLYIFFMVLGFMMLFLIVSRLTWENKRVIALLMYLVVIATWLGAIHYQLFYLTTLALLCLIVWSYYTNYRDIKSKNALLVLFSFGILLLSHAFFIFVIYSRTIYVIAEITQLIGFLCLLIPFILIFKKKPKKHYKLVK